MRRNQSQKLVVHEGGVRGARDPRVDPVSIAPRDGGAVSESTSETTQIVEAAKVAEAAKLASEEAAAVREELETKSAELAAKSAELDEMRTRLEDAERRAKEVESRAAENLIRAEAAEHERRAADARTEAAARVVTKLRGIVETLERVELDLAETRSDALNLTGRALVEMGHSLEGMPQVKPMEIVCSEYPSAMFKGPLGVAHREIARVPEEQDRPTVKPDAFDIESIMQAAENL